MAQIRTSSIIILGTAGFYLLMLAVNEWVFTRSEFVRGINWIYLPAGARFLCVLLFGSAGAVGVLLASWIATFWYFFPHDFIRSFMGGILSALAPYMVYLISRHAFGLRVSLVNLTPAWLLIGVVAYAFSNALLHHIWFFLSGQTQNLVEGFFIMFTGDLSGSLLLIYAIKALLIAFRLPGARYDSGPKRGD